MLDAFTQVYRTSHFWEESVAYNSLIGLCQCFLGRKKALGVSQFCHLLHFVGLLIQGRRVWLLYTVYGGVEHKSLHYTSVESVSALHSSTPYLVWHLYGLQIVNKQILWKFIFFFLHNLTNIVILTKNGVWQQISFNWIMNSDSSSYDTWSWTARYWEKAWYFITTPGSCKPYERKYLIINMTLQKINKFDSLNDAYEECE